MWKLETHTKHEKNPVFDVGALSRKFTENQLTDFVCFRAEKLAEPSPNILSTKKFEKHDSDRHAARLVVNLSASELRNRHFWSRPLYARPWNFDKSSTNGSGTETHKHDIAARPRGTHNPGSPTNIAQTIPAQTRVAIPLQRENKAPEQTYVSTRKNPITSKQSAGGDDRHNNSSINQEDKYCKPQAIILANDRSDPTYRFISSNSRSLFNKMEKLELLREL